MKQKAPDSGEKKVPRTKVFFRWHYPPDSDGEEVRVCGSCPELGDWDPARGVPLTRHGDCLASRAVLLPLRRRVEYKYCICGEVGNFLRWESVPTNRCLVPTGLRQIIEDDDGGLRQMGEGEGTIAEDPVGRPLSPPPDSPRKMDSPDRGPRLSGPRDKEKDSPESTASKQAERRREMGLMEKSPVVMELAEDQVVFIVFPMLPVTVVRAEEPGQFTVVTNAANECAVLPFLLHFNQKGLADGFKYKVHFVGQPGIHVQDRDERNTVTELLAEHRCIPVFVDEAVSKQHNEFAVAFLWPLFHNIKVFDKGIGEKADQSEAQLFNEGQWKSYKALNTAFAEVIEKHGSSKALIWIHDYQLLLVPRNLYLRCPDWGVGLFIHSAFPSSEVFLCLPPREEILHSMLNAKLITFQIFDYMRNFISCCNLIFGATHTFRRGGIMQIEHESKSVALTADHFVLPYQLVKKHLGDSEVLTKVTELKEKFKGKIVIGSYDKADGFSGLKLKLRLFHKFLSEYRSYQGKIVLVQLLSDDCHYGAESLAKQVQELEEQAQVTNKKFASKGDPDPVSVILDHEGLHTRLASMQLFDVLFDTSINDGLNLNPFLFYAAHAEDKKGLVVLSEFCGCSRALTGSFKINPWHGEEAMKTLDEVLNMRESQRQATMFAKDHSYVSSQSLVQWVTQNLVDLKTVQQRSAETHQVSGFDACFRQKLATESGFRHLNIEAVEKAYKKAKRRVIFLDNEGTIASKASMRMQAGSTALLNMGCAPSPDLMHRLTTLAKDAKNIVVVISGRDKKTLSEWFKDAKGVGLCAEHGFYHLPPAGLLPKGTDGENRSWQCSTESLEIDADWKVVVIELMKQYVKRVQGSIVEIKGSAISWNYRGVGASMVVSQTALELARFMDPLNREGVMYGYPVKVVCGKGYVEVKRSDIDKGVSVNRVLEEATEHDKGVVPDFVLCIGDDRSDEDMFEAVRKFIGQCGQEDDTLSPGTAHGSMANLAQPDSPLSPKVPSRRTSEASQRRAKTDEAVEQTPAATHAERRPAKGLGASAAGPSSSVFTVTVGRKPSQAQYFLKSVDEVSTLLEKITKVTVVSSMSRYSSMPQLFDPVAAGSSDSDDNNSRGGPTLSLQLGGKS